jgi:hypothetical protein
MAGSILVTFANSQSDAGAVCNITHILSNSSDIFDQVVCTDCETLLLINTWSIGVLVLSMSSVRENHRIPTWVGSPGLLRPYETPPSDTPQPT